LDIHPIFYLEDYAEAIILFSFIRCQPEAGPIEDLQEFTELQALLKKIFYYCNIDSDMLNYLFN